MSRVAQVVGQIYGLVHPIDLARSRVTKILVDSGIQLLPRRLTQDDVKEAVAELAAAGMVHQRSGTGVVAYIDWAGWLAMAAHDAGHLDPIVRAFERHNPYAGFLNPLTRAMALRCHVLAGRADDLRAFAPIAPRDWHFLAQPGLVPLVRTLPAEHTVAALAACVELTIATAAPADAVLALVEELAPTAPELAADVSFAHVLHGRFDEARAVFDRFRDLTVPSKVVRVAEFSTKAFIATLTRDDVTAVELIDAAMAAEKAGTKRRNVFPPPRAFALALLSLARLGTPPAAALLEQLLRVGRKQHPHPHFVACAANALVASVPLRPPDHTVPGESPAFSALLHGLACCWHDNFRDFEMPVWQRSLVGYSKRAAQHGWQWAAAEGFLVIAKGGEVFKHAVKDDAAQLRQRGLDLHQALGTESLTLLIEPLQAWEHPLKALEQLAFNARAKPGKKTTVRAPAAPRRLAWEVRERARGIPAVEPREQKANRDGTWSRGRAVSLKRLQGQGSTLEFLTDQDRAVAATISERRSGYYGYRTRIEHSIDARGMFALAGHPHVINEFGDPVEVVLREPELFIDELGDQLFARIEPHGADAGTYQAMLASDTRLEVTHFSADHKRLFDVIPEDGLKLPLVAKHRLVEAVAALASQVRIHSGIEGGVLNDVTVVDADPELWVQLVPSGDGLSVTLLVQPIAESGAYFTPGAGGTTVYAERDGQSVQATRDLVAERRAVADLQRAAALLAWSDSTEPVSMPDPADCLELLDQLHAAGARCLWPKGERFKIVAHADTPQLRLSIKSAAEWFATSGELAVDEKRVLDLARLFALLDASASRFLELEDGQFVALSQSFRRQLDELKAVTVPAKGGARRMHPLAAAVLDDLLEDSQVESDGAWQATRERLQQAQTLEPELPSTLQAELRPYQREGFQWLARLSHWGVGACLADDMGLGKTVQTLALLLHRATAGAALVVAPTSVAPNWSDEIRRFAPTLNAVHYSGDPESRRAMLDNLGAFDVVIVTYGLLLNDVEAFAAVEWQTAVLDEAQAIKNAATRRARAAFSLNAAFRLITTGTPVQNNLMDLHSLFGFANPGLLGSAAQFRQNYALPIERDGDVDAAARLRRLIAPFVLRRLKSEVLDDLPSRTEITLHVELSAAEANLYETLRRRAVDNLLQARDETLNPGERHVQVLAHLTKLRLACCNPSLVLETAAPASSKLAMFAETLRELLDNRHKVLVFSQFVSHLKLIAAHLDSQDIRYQYLDGSTRQKTRTERIAAFQSGEGDVFLISLKAGGTGLNLTAADYVIHMDPWWNPAVEDQASDRAHRIGQTRPVTIYRLVTKGTIEEQVVDLHRHKRDLADRLLEGSDTAGRLNADELLQLLREPM